MKIRTLSIGNSFSQDACYYIHQQAKSMGIDFETVNLYIGGCSLEMHWNNWEGDHKNYSEELNGTATGAMVSIKEALTNGKYDVVTLQQASHFSGMWNTYEPFLTSLAAVVREYQPEAKLMIHQTWAYETDSNHGSFPHYNRDQKLMYTKLRDCYSKAAEAVGGGLIPVGDMVQTFREKIPEFDYGNGGVSLNRDGFHLSLPCGRYLAGLVWIRTITELIYGKKTELAACTFIPAEAKTEEDCRRLDVIRRNVQDFGDFRAD